MITRKEETLWVERYRPSTIADIILPKKLKATMQGYVDDGFVPNAIFSGPPGVGKTTAAKALFNQLGLDYYFVNSSLNGGIATLRDDIIDFASASSIFTGKRKYVLMDEADYLNPQSTQPALRGVIEEFSRSCGFVLTCNFPARMMDAIVSRCPVIDFSIPPAEMPELVGEFYNLLEQILRWEKVEYKSNVVIDVIERNFPDWRKILNVLQHMAKNGQINDILASRATRNDIDHLWKFLKDSDFKKVREWCSNNGTEHPRELFRDLYEMSDQYLSLKGQAQLALSLNKYEYNAAFVANQEINLVAAMVEVMVDCEFKEENA